MNILLCGATMGLGGAETHVLTLATELARKGHRVTVAAERGELCSELKREGIRFIRVPLAGRGTRSAVKAYSILKKLLVRWDFDVVHAHSRLSALVISALRKREGFDFRFVVTAHAKYKTTRALRLLSVWGDRCIAVSRDVKRHLVENYGVEPERIKVIPNGVDVSRFVPSGRGDRRSILFVSRLDADCSRGAEALCRIAPALVREFPDLGITLAGGGSELVRIRRLVAEANRAAGRECVRAVGACSDIAGLMAKHAVVVGVSRVALEAMAMKKTVILFGNEGALGLLDEEKLSLAAASNFTCRGNAKYLNDGFLLSELRRALLLDGGRRERMLRRCLDEVREKYSIDKTTDATISVYCGKKDILPRIAIGGYYGFGNLGDGCVLAAIVHELKRRLPNARITVFTRGGRAVEGVKGVCFARRSDPLSLVRVLMQSDVYISGGGSLLQNATSLRSLV